MHQIHTNYIVEIQLNFNTVIMNSKKKYVFKHQKGGRVKSKNQIVHIFYYVTYFLT